MTLVIFTFTILNQVRDDKVVVAKYYSFRRWAVLPNTLRIFIVNFVFLTIALVSVDLTCANHAFASDAGSMDVNYRDYYYPYNMIKHTQQTLTQLGYDPKGVDGLWGENTFNAIVQFQKDKNLPMTGRLDLETKKRLFIHQ